MSSAQAILLFIFATNMAVGFIVFITHPRRSQNRRFLLFSASLSAWIMFVLSTINSQNVLTAEISIRSASIAGAFIPVTFYLFCQSIASPQLSFLRLCAKTKLILALSMGVSFMCGTSFFLKTIIMPSVENGLQVPEANYGSGFTIFMLFFPIMIYRTVYIFYRKLKTSKGIARTEMQFALVGMTSALPIAIIIHFVAIVSGSSQPQQYGPLCIIPMNLVIAYGIATRHILDIETVLRRATAYALLATFLTLVYTTSWIVINFLLRDVMRDPSLLAQVAATIIALLCMAPAQGRMRIAANKLISAKLIDTTTTMKKAGELFRSVSTIDSLFEHFSLLLKDAFVPKEITVFGLEGPLFKQQYPKRGTQKSSLFQDNPIAGMLRHTKDAIYKEALMRVRETAQTRAVKIEMEKTDASIAVGIFEKGHLKGILLMGAKIDKGIYDKNEQDTLQLLCNHFAVALENAHLYTAMQDSKIRNEIMLEQLASGVVVADPERKITLINKEAERITGLTEKQVLGQDLGVLPDPISNALETVLATKRGIQDTPAVLPAQNKENGTHVRMGSAYLLGHDQNPMGALLVFTDMTELKGLEEQVRRTAQLSSVGTLAAGMAHEIKNPLVTIKTFTHLLPKRHDDPEFREEFSSLVAHEVSRIDTIVNQLLRFSKPPQPHLLPMRLHDTIEQTLRLVREQLAQKKIDLSNNLRAKHDLVSGDADLLAQTLVNINLNAIEAIGSNGTISVSTTNCTYRFAQGGNPDNAVSKDCIRVQIRDTGKGIAENQLQKIFDPFYTNKSKGTGMGLSVVHGIIKEHHGVIEVASKPGEGTTFNIYIPILKETPA